MSQFLEENNVTVSELKQLANQSFKAVFV
jgi:hypothetical protein